MMSLCWGRDSDSPLLEHQALMASPPPPKNCCRWARVALPWKSGIPWEAHGQD